jgi:hypothetical protein
MFREMVKRRFRGARRFRRLALDSRDHGWRQKQLLTGHARDTIAW